MLPRGELQDQTWGSGGQQTQCKVTGRMRWSHLSTRKGIKKSCVLRQMRDCAVQPNWTNSYNSKSSYTVWILGTAMTAYTPDVNFHFAFKLTQKQLRTYVFTGFLTTKTIDRKPATPSSVIPNKRWKSHITNTTIKTISWGNNNASNFA